MPFIKIADLAERGISTAFTFMHKEKNIEITINDAVNLLNT